MWICHRVRVLRDVWAVARAPVWHDGCDMDKERLARSDGAACLLQREVAQEVALVYASLVAHHNRGIAVQ